MPVIRAEDLTDFTVRIFEACGVPAEEAKVVADGLVGANLRGHDSHGVMRVPQYVGFVEEGVYRPGAGLKVESEGPATVVADAQWGFGQVQAHRLLDLLIPKARQLGVAAGAAKDCGHIGRLGEYAERAAAQGMVLIATVNNNGAGQRVAPPGGLEPRLGTNPLCAAVPTEDGPVVLDFGTSVAAEGKVRVYHINNQPVPEGWLLDSQGQPTTDPSVLYTQPSGSIRPMGGAQAYKGFGLALVLDMLSAGFSGGRACHEGAPPARGNNVLFLLLDPARFAGTEAMLRESTGVCRFVRNTPTAEGVDAITLPGDPERSVLEARSRDGIPLSEGHWAKLVELADRLGVSFRHP
ncbi:Ldh family oxidoreductase [Tautonia sociabilis]|uniref:Ldh family oxidoreductase n=1 Tax=Tautonia sociabilis TaxID=2080755 RepID=A0A432MRQ7_9BACT|nr:Ldh family oxidoreductase [Tautonia sociabilis]RUL89677.1 Ldh family oxidoreductase [Tautonia sociabilis]